MAASCPRPTPSPPRPRSNRNDAPRKGPRQAEPDPACHRPAGGRLSPAGFTGGVPGPGRCGDAGAGPPLADRHRPLCPWARRPRQPVPARGAAGRARGGDHAGKEPARRLGNRRRLGRRGGGAAGARRAGAATRGPGRRRSGLPGRGALPHAGRRREAFPPAPAAAPAPGAGQSSRGAGWASRTPTSSDPRRTSSSSPTTTTSASSRR